MTTQAENKADYEVGYCKPPKHTQFKKGQSGNPRGTPAPKSLEQLAVEVCARQVVANVDGKSRRITVEEAILIGQAKKGITGDHKSAKFLLELKQKAPPPQVELTMEELEEDLQEALAGLPLDEIRVIAKYNSRMNEIGKRRQKK